MTATDDRVWSEFGLCTPEQIAVYRVQALTEADVCTCEHFRREHFQGGGCQHSAVRYSPSSYRLPCDCEAFSAVQTPGGQENG